jgi:hypothetical protein
MQHLRAGVVMRSAPQAPDTPPQGGCQVSTSSDGRRLRRAIKSAINRTPLISVVLAILGFEVLRSWIFRISKPSSILHSKNSVKADLQQPNEQKKRRKSHPVALFVILTILAAIGGWIAFKTSNPAAAQRPSFKTGGILVFVNDARETGIIVSFTANESGYFAISVTSSDPDQAYSDSFLVVASGSASVIPVPRPNEELNPPGYLEFTNKAHIASVAVDDKGDLAASDDGAGYFSIDHEESYDLNGYDGQSGVTVAETQQDDGNQETDGNDVLCGRLRNPISQSSGGAVLGGLPLIGAPGNMLITSPGGADSSSVGAITIGGDLSNLDSNARTRWYEPHAQVNINVSYTYGSADICNPTQENDVSLLPPRYLTAGSNPATVNSNELSWKVSNSGQVGWNLTDSDGQQRDATRLFISGILLGAAASFLGIALDRAISRGRED